MTNLADFADTPSLAELEDERRRGEEALLWLEITAPESYAHEVVRRRLDELTAEIERLT